MKQPLISIVTSTYNPTKLILETYHELQKQNYKNFEWIIVDDMSDNNNNLLLDISNEKKLNIKIIYNKENRGPSFCRNLGAKEANGDYLMFLDDDDLYSENLLEKMVQIISDQQMVIVYAQTKNFYEQGNQFFYIEPADKLDMDFRGLDVLEYSLNSMFVHHGSLLLPKEYFNNIGGYDERLLVDEDGNLLFKLFLENYKFKRVNEAFHLYRQHNSRDRLSFNESDERIENRVLAMEILVDMLDKKGLLKKYSYEIALRYDHIALAACSRNKKLLTQKILNMAEGISPKYLQQRKTLKVLLRRLLGCANYDRLLRGYAYILKKISKVEK